MDIPDTVQLDSAANLNPDGTVHPFLPFRLTIIGHRLPGAESDRDEFLWPADWDRYNYLGWRFTAPDSVVLEIANIVSMWVYELRTSTHQDSLTGRAIRYFDAEPDGGPTISITGKRVACTKPARGAV